MANVPGVELTQTDNRKFPNATEDFTNSDRFFSNDRELKTQLVNATFNEIVGVQQVAYAATITPDASQGAFVNVAALTGNITVANPINGTVGQNLIFIFLQDATGTRTITFGAAYRTNWTPSTTANKKSTIQFLYDGASWHQVGSAVNI